MRVLHVIPTLGIGGAEKLLSSTLSKMKSEEIQIELLILEQGNKELFDSINKSITIYNLNTKSYFSISTMLKINKIIKNGDFDIIHVHLFPTLYIVAFLSIFNRQKAKIFYSEHSTTNKRRKFGFRFIENIIYSKYTKIIAISEGVKDSLNSWLNKRNRSKIVVIENGISLETFREALPYKKEDLGFNDKDIIITMVARFNNSKDHKTLVDAIKYLPKNYHVILVGDGELRASVQSYVDSNELQNNVKFLGIRHDIPRILQTTDAFVISSNWEGFGLVAVEAMAAGKIVLGSDVKGLSGVINNPDLLFEKGNSIELANKILDNMLNDAIRTKNIAFIEENVKRYDENTMIK